MIASALNDRCSGLLETVDIDAVAGEAARVNVRGRPGGERVTFTLRDATTRLDELINEGRRFGLIFVDHWHGYRETYEAADRGRLLLQPGGFILFHDFLDPGNVDPAHPYGVLDAVRDVLGRDSSMAFEGTCGSSALFRKH